MRRGLTCGPVHRVEEDEIARAKISGIDIGAGPELLGDGAWHVDAVLIEHVPDESAAIEPGRIAAAVPVRRSAELQRGSRNRIAVGSSRRWRRGRCRLRGRIGFGRSIRSRGRWTTRYRERLWNRSRCGAGRRGTRQQSEQETTHGSSLHTYRQAPARATLRFKIHVFRLRPALQSLPWLSRTSHGDTGRASCYWLKHCKQSCYTPIVLDR